MDRNKLKTKKFYRTQPKLRTRQSKSLLNKEAMRLTSPNLNRNHKNHSPLKTKRTCKVICNSRLVCKAPTWGASCATQELTKPRLASKMTIYGKIVTKTTVLTVLRKTMLYSSRITGASISSTRETSRCSKYITLQFSKRIFTRLLPRTKRRKTGWRKITNTRQLASLQHLWLRM